MKIQIKTSSIIRPAQEIPKHCLRISDLDQTVPAIHTATVYFYRRPAAGCSNFFEADLMKESLSNVLVSFYPMAGRLGRDENGRIEIQYNGEGVVLLEAETSCGIDDLGDFESSVKLMNLVPPVDLTEDISSYPLMLVQVTRFKCGGVCLGVMLHHTLADATSTYHFLISWGETARGLPISIPPFIDRTVLDVGLPPSPSFHHTEYSLSPSMNTPIQNPGPISTAILKLSPDQINTLREKSKKEHEPTTTEYSRFVIIAAHVWRCVCKARGLSVDQATKLHIPTTGRSKLLNPMIPLGYLGNVSFSSAPIALSGDIQSESLNYTVERIHKAVKQMNDKYLKSALAYLKQQPDLKALRRGAHTYGCPNLLISKLMDMPVYGANFGWGGAVFSRIINDIWDGEVYILPGPAADGSLLVIIDLYDNHLQLFKKLFYDIFFQCSNERSRY